MSDVYNLSYEDQLAVVRAGIDFWGFTKKSQVEFGEDDAAIYSILPDYTSEDQFEMYEDDDGDIFSKDAPDLTIAGVNFQSSIDLLANLGENKCK